MSGSRSSASSIAPSTQGNRRRPPTPPKRPPPVTGWAGNRRSTDDHEDEPDPSLPDDEHEDEPDLDESAPDDRSDEDAGDPPAPYAPVTYRQPTSLGTYGYQDRPGGTQIEPAPDGGGNGVGVGEGEATTPEQKGEAKGTRKRRRPRNALWRLTKRRIVLSLVLGAVLTFALALLFFPILLILIVYIFLTELLSFGSDPSDQAIAEIPAELLAIYQEAATGCEGLDWTVVAGIARVESVHGTLQGGRMGEDGTVTPSIRGIALDGTNGTMVIRDTDGGRLDGDTVYDRAVGPFQFIPSTWAMLGVDANGDGVADPNNFHDAAAAAVRHLCPSGKLGNLRSAIFSYNHSASYVDDVLSFAAAYAARGVHSSSGSGVIVTVTSHYCPSGNCQKIEVDQSIALNVQALLDAAADDGIILHGWGYRDSEAQIQLRIKNGCPDIWTSPSSSCRIPTAIPGNSMHEKGLAIDFQCNGHALSQHCYRWLVANANGYGLYNFPVERWHWSTNGK
jgi:hypothetical protein